MKHPVPAPVRWLRPLALACALAAACGAARADAFTLTGNFARDDQVSLFNVTLTTAGSFELRSLGYGGGVDTNGVTRVAGGFDTMAFLYSATGTLLAQSDDGVGVSTDPLTGLAADAAFTISLAAGRYVVALTQYDNFPLGNLAAGFSRAGTGNFTPSLSPTCTATAFCDWSGAARGSQWVLTFNGIGAVSPVPEPASALLMLVAGTGLLAWRRRAGVQA